MKHIYLLFIFTISFGSIFAQEGNWLWVNAHPDYSSITVEVRTQPDNTLYSSTSIDYISSNAGVAVPSGTIIDLLIINTSSGATISNLDNEVFDPNEGKISTIYKSSSGGGSIRTLGITNFPISSSQSLYKFYHVSENTGSIDFQVRDGDVQGEELELGDIVDGITYLDAASSILDIVDAGTCQTVFAEDYNGSDFGGEQILILLANEGLFVYDMEGTVTELTDAAPLVCSNVIASELNDIKIYPTITSSSMNVEFTNQNSLNIQYSIFTQNGLQLEKGEVSNGSIDVRNLPPGIHYIHFNDGNESKNRVHKFIKI